MRKKRKTCEFDPFTPIPSHTNDSVYNFGLTFEFADKILPSSLTFHRIKIE